MARKALVIGINYVNDEQNKLNGCGNDAEKCRALVRKNGFTVTTISDAISGAKPPTKRTILKEFEKLVATAKAGDTLWFSYSGHGGQTVDRSGDEPDRRDEFIYTGDKQFITDDEFREVLANLPVGVRLLSLMDCCNSGSIFDAAHNLEGGTQILHPYSFSHGVFAVYSASKDPQLSAEAFINGGYAGAMTSAFLEEEAKRGRGFENILADSFSGSKKKVKSIMDGINAYLKYWEYDQQAQFTSEGAVQSPILTGYQVQEYTLRQTRARQLHAEDYTAVKVVDSRHLRLG